MSSPANAATPRLRGGDVAFALFLLVVFIGGFVATGEWPYRAALFPRLLSAAGVMFAVLKLVGYGLQVRGRSAAKAPAGTGRTVGDTELVSEEEEEDLSLEYVFSSAGGRAWAGVLAWIAVFFFSLWLLGVFITVPLFAFAYLRLSGGAGWLGAAIYSAVTGAVIYLAFRQLLSVPMPIGIF